MIQILDEYWVVKVGSVYITKKKYCKNIYKCTSDVNMAYKFFSEEAVDKFLSDNSFNKMSMHNNQIYICKITTTENVYDMQSL